MPKTKKDSIRKKTAEIYANISGFEYYDEIDRDMTNELGGYYVGDGMIVYPNGRMEDEDPTR